MTVSSTNSSPGELFVTMAKEITIGADGFLRGVSYALQYGVPLGFFVISSGHVRFEPSGWTGNHGALRERLIMVIFGGWALHRRREYANSGEAGEASALPRMTERSTAGAAVCPGSRRRPSCSECSGLMTRNGSCYRVRELRRD
jgi:ribonucleoside-diphosphate reductase alpha chain